MQEPKKDKQKTYGFFRMLTIGVLVAVGFLMLGESLNIFKFYAGDLALSKIYPLIIIFSTVILWNYQKLVGKILGLFLFFLVFGGFFSVGIYTSLNQYTKNTFSQNIKNSIHRASLVNLSIENFVGFINLEGDKINKFVEGKYKSDRNLIVDSYVSSGNSYFVIKEDKNRNILQDYQTNLNLKVDKNQFISLYIKNFFGQHLIDLSNISWKDANIHLGGADLNIVLGDKIVSGNVLQVQSTFSNITLQVPSDVGIRLYSKRFVGIMRGDMVKKGKSYYESKNINEAKKILNLDIKSVVGLIDIVRIAE